MALVPTQTPELFSVHTASTWGSHSPIEYDTSRGLLSQGQPLVNSTFKLINPNAVVYEGKRFEESPDESIGSPDWVISQAKDTYFPKSLSDKLEYLKAALKAEECKKFYSGLSRLI